ncbi:hypothetical protein C4J97_4490 [Pseudomonas orientalis]|nr:hypothetical protein C4J97_4490 [Pseudomonas orientalis]
MRLLFLGFSSPVAGLEATEGKVAQEWPGMKVGICGKRFPTDSLEGYERQEGESWYDPD